eukprot:m.69496 g.69496  ORF g.69496 m.69496 type:complete len:445 (+) comp24097_c0_seq2:79-1413(+)
MSLRLTTSLCILVVAFTLSDARPHHDVARRGKGSKSTGGKGRAPGVTDDAADRKNSARDYRFDKMSGAPSRLSYPLDRKIAKAFDSEETNAVSLRTFTDLQVRHAISSMTFRNKPVKNFDDLNAKVYGTHVNLRPTHADSPNANDRALFWNEFRELIEVQRRRKAGERADSIFTPAKTITEALGSDMLLSDGARAVFDDFPTDFPTKLAHHLISMNNGGLGKKLNKVIFNQCSYAGPEFVNGFVAIGELIGWAIREVSPAAFASKWAIGRARPEEVAWTIHENLGVAGQTISGFPVPSDIVAAIAAMDLQDRADFTAYKGGGSPMHPSYPAMHSAASTCATWLSVVFDLTEEEMDEIRLLDFSISYFRTVAGVHYRSDNAAGLSLGQNIIKSKLADHLAEMYGCNGKSRNIIRAEVERKIALHVDKVNWATWLPQDFKEPLAKP